MWRHASVFHWYTCKVFFSTTSPCLPIRLFFLISLHCPMIRCKLSVQAPRIVRDSLWQHGLLFNVFNAKLLLYTYKLTHHSVEQQLRHDRRKLPTRFMKFYFKYTVCQKTSLHNVDNRLSTLVVFGRNVTERKGVIRNVLYFHLTYK